MSKVLRGAFVSFTEAFVVPVPNIIPFQFNPESISHAWSPAPSAGSGATNPLATSGPPAESFDFTLMLDANETIADNRQPTASIAQVDGVYTRMAALELLMHPVPANAAGALVGAISAAAGGLSAAIGGGVARTVPASQLPTVLFVWGPGRIVPVKVRSLAFSETLYDAKVLNPVHAEARIGLQVLTPRELQSVKGPLAEVARMAYSYSQKLRTVRSLANIANAAEASVGMLPF